MSMKTKILLSETSWLNMVDKLICTCGGLIRRPLPAECPHCGAPIRRVRPHIWSHIYPLLVVTAIFGCLVAFLWWMSTAQ